MADRFRYLVVFELQAQAFAHKHSQKEEQQERRRSQFYTHLGDEHGYEHQDGCQEQKVF